IDFGLEDFIYDDENIYITTSFQDFGSMQKAIEEKNIEIGATDSQYIPIKVKKINDEQKAEVKALLDALEDDDDVQAVYNNML
ncbi:MAG: YebC/PmpR family DNA-binding transcriptional regulator, partial [Bacteroidota bacterium]